MKIAFISDFHFHEQFPLENGVDPFKNWEIILQDLEKQHIDQIMVGGDIGESSAHDLFFATLKNSLLPFQIILGNHDQYYKVQKFYQNNASKALDKLYYAEETPFFKMLYLDSSSNKMDDQQLLWLTEQCKTIKQLIVFIHHPILEINSVIDKLYPLVGREKYKIVLENHSNKVSIFCGHYHFSDETKHLHLTQYTTPAVSFQINKSAREIEIENKFFGYRILEIKKDRISTECVLFNHS